MARIKQYKTARRLGARIFPKTENPKFVPTKQRRRGKRGPRPLSEYGTQLLEKQKVRYYYGIRERQLANYAKASAAQRRRNPAEELYKTLESRLDNVIYRLGFAPTRAFARQLVSHGHILVNDKKMTIPSYQVRKEDRITIRKESRDKKVFETLPETLKEHTPPNWLTRTDSKEEGVVAAMPEMEEGSEELFNLTLVIGYYTR